LTGANRGELRAHLAPFYSHTGRPSIDPEDRRSTPGCPLPDRTLKTSDRTQQIALRIADLDLAIWLWQMKDWRAYKALQGSSVDVLKQRRLELIEPRHIQFIWFVNSHLRTHMPMGLSSQQMFETDLPECVLNGEVAARRNRIERSPLTITNRPVYSSSRPMDAAASRGQE
jgi:hypothetical protein